MQFASSGLKALEDSYRRDGTLRHPKSEFFRELLNHIKTLSNQRRFWPCFRRFFTVSRILLNYCTQRASKELHASAGNQVK